jgi:hypothetical protein
MFLNWDSEFSFGKVGFALKFKNEVSPYKVMGVFVLPEERITFEALSEDKSATYEVRYSAGNIYESKTTKWIWQAPSEKGHYTIQIKNISSDDEIVLNVFVMIPYSELKGEYLNGYRIGCYPQIPLKDMSIYRPPRGFIEITEENANTLVSPHFAAKQFLSKQAGGYPKYLVLKERLILKLELILEEVNKRGYRCNTFQIQSGYRTPSYNKTIGNVKYSRHVWGGAVDIFIDEKPKNGIMDDLNGDGAIDYRDAAIIYDIIDEMYGKSFYEAFVGGLGWYRKTSRHGPFVHVDVRGFRVRWGD